ncbi:MAG TPA: 50S ribosomal protein L29 [Brumimicrobium sp.]|nr:50S ribosomal protein L29 [Brumimicrobium sp.]
MKLIDIRELSIDDLQAKIAEEKENYAKLKVSHKVSVIENPLSIRKSRKDIARMLTVLNEKLAQQ